MGVEPEVSIICPTYNSQRFVVEAIESVFRQSYRAWELLLIDDGSTDHTPSVLENLSKSDSRIRTFLLRQNRGPATARNHGIMRSSGRYIAFLDSDDLWLSEKLNIQINFMKRIVAPISFCTYRRIDEMGRICSSPLSVPDYVDYRRLLLSNIIGCSTVMYDRKHCGMVLFPDIYMRQDYGMWLRILRQGHCAFGIHQDLVRYRLTRDSLTRNKLTASLYSWKLYREIEQLGLLRSLYCFGSCAMRSYFKSLR